PVRDAAVRVYVDRLADLSADVPPQAQATTDASGIAALPGTRELDPDLALSFGYSCGERPENCPRLFVRVDGPKGMALMPLEYRFAVDSYRASRYTVFEQSRREYGHLHAWGTTAQGV